MHFLEKPQGKDYYVANKISMEKAFDRVEWNFLFEIVRGLGFDEKWAHWMPPCLSTASFSTLNNSIPRWFHTSDERHTTGRSSLPLPILARNKGGFQAFDP